jgi:hypothetical protein
MQDMEGAAPGGLDDLPGPLRQAIEAMDGAAFQEALDALPEEERAAVLERLQGAGLIQGAPDMDVVLRDLDPLLGALAAAAGGGAEQQAELESALLQLEAGGWQLSDAVRRIWAGERDTDALTAAIDPNSALLVQRLLEQIGAPRAAAGQGLPPTVQAAFATGDPAALEVALAALSASERTRIEALIVEASAPAIERARRRQPEEILADLPEQLRDALMQGDDDAFRAALTALPEGERLRALADIADLQALSLAADQEEQRRDPRERFAPLIQAIAQVAAGDARPRASIEAELAEFEAAGWQVRGPVARIWAGERDRDSLVAGLDEQDALLIQGALDLLVAGVEPAPPEEQAPAAPAPRRKGRATPSRDKGAPPPADLPAAVQAAVEGRDSQALQAALAGLPPDERQAVFERLKQDGIIGVGSLDDRTRPDIEQVIARLMPLLGDIALAALGDETARQIAEVMMPQLEAGGWRLAAPARRLWGGERDAAALTAGLDPNSAALMQRILGLVAAGPAAITDSGAVELARVRSRAREATAQALAGPPEGRAALAQQLDDLAEQAMQQLGAPWQDLAAELRGLAGRLLTAA